MSPEEREGNDALESLIARYLEADKSGQNLDREALISEHPELADSLRVFFANHDPMTAAANLDEPTIPPHGRGLDDPTIPPNQRSQEDATIPPQPVGDDPTLPPTEGATQQADPSVGDHVRYFGDYELLEEIARGGMGVVFKARQVNLNRIVALKMILAGQFAGQEDVQRFYTEAEAAANLDHAGIVPIFEIGEHEGQHYFSMGYIEGESLAQKVADGPLKPREAAELVKGVCDAMAYAHERGVIHRDLKPANILIDKNGQPKVTDFGLAKKTETDSNLTGTGQILGTPAYMPPEQASGKTDVGPLADVYSIGAVLYCLLTGRPPFQAASPMDTLLGVLNNEPIPPRQLNPGVPADLETICLKCLNKDPQGRYRTAESFANDLQRYLNAEPIKAHPIGKLRRAWKWCKRKPAAAILSVTTVISLIAVVAISAFSYLRISETLAQFRRSLRFTMGTTDAPLDLKVGSAALLYDLDQDAQAVIPTLIDGLRATNRSTVQMAATTLGEIGPEAEVAIPALIEANKNRPSGSREKRIGDQWVDFTYTSLALYQVGFNEDSRATFITALNECVNDDNPWNDREFIDLLSLVDVNPRAAIPLHIEAIESGSLGGIAWANEYLMRLGQDDASCVEPLKRGLQNQSADVRRWCTAALLKLCTGSLPARNELAKALSDDDPTVVRFAALALGITGHLPHDRLSELDDYKRDRELRCFADWTMRQSPDSAMFSPGKLPLLQNNIVSRESDGGSNRLTEALFDSLRNGSRHESEGPLLRWVAALLDTRVTPDVRSSYIHGLLTSSMGMRRSTRSQVFVSMSPLEAIARVHPDYVGRLRAAGMVCLSDNSPKVREAGAYLIRSLAEHAMLAVPALIVATEYEKGTAQEAAKETLDLVLHVNSSPRATEYTSTWLSPDSYKGLLPTMRLLGSCPSMIEGRVISDRNRIRANFVKMRQGLLVRTFTGLSEKRHSAYEDHAESMRRAGYIEAWHDSFRSKTGDTLHSTIWEKDTSSSDQFEEGWSWTVFPM